MIGFFVTLIYYRPRTKYDGRLYFQFVYPPRGGGEVSPFSGPMFLLGEGRGYSGQD